MKEADEKNSKKNIIDNPKLDENKKKIIEEQMKTCIFQIIGKKKKIKGTGFFCKIFYENETIPILLSHYHILNDKFFENNEYLDIYINDKKTNKRIEIDKNLVYIKKEYNIVIIKLKPEDEITNFLELDENLFDFNSEKKYLNDDIYILQYPENKDAKVYYGKIIELKNEYDFTYKCNIKYGSAGAPILQLSSNKVIGIQGINLGTFLKYPLKSNEINIKIKIDKEDINNEIYFLDNTAYSHYRAGIKINHFHDNLKELTKNNTELYINNERIEFSKFFVPKEEGTYSIKLKLKILLTDCSYMFYKCNNLITIDLSSLDTNFVTNMKSMFYECINLENINLSNFVTKNVENMEEMFAFCSKLETIDLSSFDTKHVSNMQWMFYGCQKLGNKLDLSSFRCDEFTSTGGMFCCCYNLKKIKFNDDQFIDKIKANYKMTKTSDNIYTF